jgi:hypothetical protein
LSIVTGECQDLEARLGESRASASSLAAEKSKVEAKLSEAEDLLGRITEERDGLKGGWGVIGARPTSKQLAMTPHRRARMCVWWVCEPPS